MLVVGATSTVVSSAAASTLSNPTVPTGTNLLSLTASQLAYYNLPQRPAASSAWYAGWVQAMQAAQDDVTNAPPNVAAQARFHNVTAGAQPWAGNVATNPQGQTYSGAQGSWVIPPPFQTDAQSRFSAQWVGVGGDCGSGCEGQLVQAGSEVDTYGSTPNYYAWFEVYPDQPTEQEITQLTVNPGDVMFVNITASLHQSYVFIEDETTHAYVHVNPAATADGCSCVSAEAVNENPGSSTGLMTFDESTYFSGVAPQNSGGNYYINNGPWTGVAATDSAGTTLAAATPPSGSGAYRVDRYGTD